MGAQSIEAFRQASGSGPQSAILGQGLSCLLCLVKEEDPDGGIFLFVKGLGKERDIRTVAQPSCKLLEM